jgi:hypothetical protein
MLFLVEVNTKHRTNLNKLCMKNTTPHVGTLGQNFSSQVKSETYLKHYLHSPVEGIWNALPNSRGVVKTNLIKALLENRGCRWISNSNSEVKR